MKKIAVALSLLAVSATAFADGYHHHGGGYRGGYWVAPAIIGGVIGYELGRPRYVYEAPPVVVQQPPVVMQNPVPIFQEVLKYNPDCQCYVKSYEQIGWK